MQRNHLASTAPHPVHATLAAFPLVLFTAALVTDVAYANTAEMQWANFSVWLIAGGVATGMLAALAGIVDAVITRRTRHRSQPVHGILTISLFVVAVINGFVHSRDAWTSVVPTGLILSLITVALVWWTTWQGYSMERPAAEAVA